MRIAISGLLFLIFAGFALAQDERTLLSPNGQLEFQLFVTQPEAALLPRLAYRVLYKAKPVIETSLMGVEIYDQEPLLGENLGLLRSSAGEDKSHSFNWLIAEYMQNGSLGRRINVEARAYNEGIAFRYVFPKSAPLDEVIIKEELTEFSFPAEAISVTKIEPETLLRLPYTVEVPGTGWVGLSEVLPRGYPEAFLSHPEGRTLLTRVTLKAELPHLAWEGRSPVAWPWRVIAPAQKKSEAALPVFLPDLQ